MTTTQHHPITGTPVPSKKLRGASTSRSKTINRDRPQDASSFPLQELTSHVATWYETKRRIASLTKTLNDGKIELKKAVHAHGVADEKGSLYLELVGIIEVAGKKIKALKNQKSVTTGYNGKYAEELLTKKGLWEEVTIPKRVIDTEAIYRIFYEKKITKAQLDKIFPTSENFSFILIDAEGKPLS